MINKELKLREKFIFIASLLFLVFIIGCGNLHNSPEQNSESSNDSIYLVQIKTDSLFNSLQQINLLHIPKSTLNNHSFDIAQSESIKLKTSQFAENKNAMAAINGSFFDVDNGGSVTYLEMHDSVISLTRSPELKWAFPKSLITGAIVLTKNNELIIQSAETDEFYEQSKEESFVLVTGPLLIENSISQELADMSFTNKRHPRSCLCNTKESIIFISIDGRSKQADGMSLIELQKYLHDLNCIDAINLDGGGSTTLWLNDQGIVNTPSDKKGERPVANALVIVKKN